jgi:hypothetical protein
VEHLRISSSWDERKHIRIFSNVMSRQHLHGRQVENGKAMVPLSGYKCETLLRVKRDAMRVLDPRLRVVPLRSAYQSAS